MANKAEAILIDSREPPWIQKLHFDGVPTVVSYLETGDAQVACSDGCMLVIERKTPEDFLNTLADQRLFPQIGRMVQARLDEQAGGQMFTWPYLVITGEFHRLADGKTSTTDRGATGWWYDSVQGALLTVQEMGCCVVFCHEAGYDDCLLRLAQRNRGPLDVLPPRPPSVLGVGPAFLAGLPGIGLERVTTLLEWGGNNIADIITGLCDPDVKLPPGIGPKTRDQVRALFGLSDKIVLTKTINKTDQEIIKKESITHV